MGLELTSSAFQQGGQVPRRYTCDGENISPPLAWSGAPEETKEFLLVCNDPDAPSGVFHHWALYNIPASWSQLDEGYGPESPIKGMHQAINDFGKPGYGGPCPPKGHGEHHYHFRLSALSSPIASVRPEITCVEVAALARPYVIEFVELIGIYGR